MDFEKICMMFAMQEPFYGILLSSMSRMPSNETKTIAVGRSGNVFKMIYNPDFVNQFSVDTVLQLLRHECLHVALCHFSIWQGEDENDSPEMHKIRNIAEDLEVNCYLDRSKVEAKAGGVWCEDLNFERCLGAKEYLRLLLQMAQQQKAQAQQPQQPCNDGMEVAQIQNQQPNNNQQQSQQQNNGNGNPQGQQQSNDSGNSGSGNGNDDIPQDFLDSFNEFDDHTMWPEENMEQLEQIVEDMLVFAAEEVEKARGTIPGELTGKIELIRNRKKPKPVADWKRYVRRYLGNEFSELIRKSKKRESRRFPDAAGNRHKRKAHMLVAIDTSGSVSMPEYREFFGQIKTLLPVATFYVVECDASIQHEYDYNGRCNEVLHGGGGTSFEPVINLFKKDQKKYEALVYFTDGYCNIPKDTPKETLWVVSSRGDQSNKKKYQVNGASVAFIPKHEE